MAWYTASEDNKYDRKVNSNKCNMNVISTKYNTQVNTNETDYLLETCEISAPTTKTSVRVQIT